MTKVTFKSTSFTRAGINKLKQSDALLDQLEPFAAAVLAAAKNDPNKVYTDSLSMHKFFTSGPLGRASWQIGADAVIGSRVEAKRGTLQRALGSAGS